MMNRQQLKERLDAVMNEAHQSPETEVKAAAVVLATLLGSLEGGVMFQFAEVAATFSAEAIQAMREAASESQRSPKH